MRSFLRLWRHLPLVFWLVAVLALGGLTVLALSQKGSSQALQNLRQPNLKVESQRSLVLRIKAGQAAGYVLHPTGLPAYTTQLSATARADQLSHEQEGGVGDPLDRAYGQFIAATADMQHATTTATRSQAAREITRAGDGLVIALNTPDS